MMKRKVFGLYLRDMCIEGLQIIDDIEEILFLRCMIYVWCKTLMIFYIFEKRFIGSYRFALEEFMILIKLYYDFGI